MKKILIGWLVVCVFSLVGCSSPATVEDIRGAIAECPDVGWHIRMHTTGTRFSRRAKLVTKFDLWNFKRECMKERKSREDPNSEENIIKRQREAF